MHKSDILHTRIEPKLKRDVEHILKENGLSSSEAIRLFYTHVRLHGGLPFPVKLPNKTTIKAMEDANSGNIFSADKVDDIFDELD